MTKPRIYCASPSPRAKMWTLPGAGILGPDVTIVSTWHDNKNFAADDQSALACEKDWQQDFAQIRQADILLAYAERLDRPNGTLVEIGYALAHETPVVLVGNYLWGTWRHLPLVTHHPTIREAVVAILAATGPGPVEAHSEGDS